MVTITLFIPHLSMKKRFQAAINKVMPLENIQIEMIHIFGTPDSLAQNRESEIFVVRGMTYVRLHTLFPEKHIVEIELSAFDIMEALIRCKEEYHPKRIALCLQDTGVPMESLEKICDAKIDLYKVKDQEEVTAALVEAEKKGTDVVVGAGTACGVSDKLGIPRIHIETKSRAIEQALSEAIKAAKTINLERTRANTLYTIINSNEDAIIAINNKGRILSLNNQAYRTYQLSTMGGLQNQPINFICKDFKWEETLKDGHDSEELLVIQSKQYYVQYKLIKVGSEITGLIIITKNTEQLMQTETKIRRKLSETGLTAKYSFKDIIHRSESMERNIQIAIKYAGVDSNVLIIGETGTGKELFAHSIHQQSNRKNQPFVTINCAALPENLLESELFGYEAGAFSGASKSGKMGLFELAHKGTLFLDEIGEMSITLQAKLLRALQEKEIRRIGSSTVQPVDVRVISATNINIEKQIQEGRFRLDLYYRLNLLDIVILPLRDRMQDIEPLLDFYITRSACELGIEPPQLTLEAAQLLTEYRWPGNVRELRNICERLTVLNETGKITSEDIKELQIFQKMKKEEADLAPIQSIESKKSMQKMAEEMGVSRTTLWRMMKKQEKEK